MTDSIHAFTEGFLRADETAWRAEVDKSLKGAPFESLVRTTLDGLVRGPLFTKQDRDHVDATGAPGHFPFVRGNTPERDRYLPWGIRQAVSHPDPKIANQQILEDLEGGASEIMLRLDPLGEAGCAIRTLDELKTTLDGVMLDLAPVHMAPSRMSPQFAALYIALLEQSGLDPNAIHGGLGLSPIGQKSFAGGGAAKLPDRLKRTSEVAEYAANTFPNLKTVFITASSPHEAGGSEAHEIAFACAGGASYMRAFIDHGLSPDQAANALEFSMAADADVHLTIAKMRAARRAWAKVAEAFGVSEPNRAMTLHVITSYRMLTTKDAYTNLIRNTCAGLGAAAGGADSVTIRPFTDAIGPGDPFARRLARNLQILLMEESHLGKVADPAGGSYLHETLAQRLAEAGWAVFQTIESRGGLFETVKTGWLQGEVAKVRASRHQRYQTGEETLIGVTKFANPDDTLPQTETIDYVPGELDGPVIEPQPFAGKLKAAKSGAHVRVLEIPEQEWEPVAPVRIGEAFEAQMDQED